jgi:hypothetical protein
MAMNLTKPIEYLGIVAGPEQIAETRARIRVPRSEVESIRFAHASPVQHPVIMFLFGIVLVAVGLFEARRLFDWLFHGAAILDVEFFLFSLLLMGVYSLFEAVRRVPVLLVKTTRGTRRMVFRCVVDPVNVGQFLRCLETDFGYPVYGEDGGGA